jgi:phosphopantothenoylcysteine decarboxylase/phosphopantothenate--cysteine ligase
VVIAPATAHVLAKMAHGLADDFLTTMLLATTAPVMVAPAMNVNMWNHAATQANVKLLRERGVVFVDPESGYLACGMTGSGQAGEREGDCAGGAGGAAARQSGGRGRAASQEGPGGRDGAGDGGRDARGDRPGAVLGNRSSGKMGYAIAEAAQRRGAQVVLVSAPTALTPPAGARLCR